MLVLSRKVGERIWIGDDIAVTVVRIVGGGVRLGIEAPAELPVIREELKLKLLKLKLEAEQSSSDCSGGDPPLLKIKAADFDRE